MHIPVLSQQIVESLSPCKGMTIIVALFGAGGHSRLVAQAIGKKGRLIAFDQDASVFHEAIVRELSLSTRFTPVVENFRNMKAALAELGVKKIDGAVFDLGLSSTQLEHSVRGFSFQRDEPLVMTFRDLPEEGDVTAEHIVNDWSEESLAAIFSGFGEERFAHSIARHIVEAREVRQKKTTGELVEVIREATPRRYHHARTHFATRVFQAIRMAVNDELGAIKEGLLAAVELLVPHGRVAALSFHSVEDRAVKTLFKTLLSEETVVLVNKKPLVPEGDEIRRNPRSRSAKLRIVERI